VYFFVLVTAVILFSHSKNSRKSEGVIILNREQYLRACIAELAHRLAFDKMSNAQRRNMEQALKFYLDDLRNNQ